MIIDSNERKVIDCAFYALNVLTEIAVYSWNGEFCKEEAVKAFDKIKKKLEDFDLFEVKGADSLNTVGARNWNEKTILCPLYLHHKYFPKEDNDHRYFCISSGWEWDGERLIKKEKDIFSDELKDSTLIPNKEEGR